MARPWRCFKIGKLELYLAWWGGWNGSSMLSLERRTAVQGRSDELIIWLGKLEIVASWPSSSRRAFRLTNLPSKSTVEPGDGGYPGNLG